ncbi:uncharacterized protein BDZ99DRAFT_548855 [Mytilinidion resinicola]|uniref:DUF6604 domain-containing protein n=1 Tax=Mytilinidion resinicola TaxID=574789 RepID=A0A6A6Z206_9PEZI|nr:uncharacterized protein BDZ99DRAFT_548855 [Mytilinidion resinicola]KAF2814749.1 hypothetical protein BDZ99DRAFT_548855 [Mytilinidion resinicola]
MSNPADTTAPKVANLVGSYKRYKSDIDCVIRWLIRIGDEQEDFVKMAKSDPKKDNTVSVTLDAFNLDFVAEMVTQRGIHVPPTILGKMKRALSLRKRCGICGENLHAWLRNQYAALATEDTQPASNAQSGDHDSIQYEIEELDFYNDMGRLEGKRPNLRSLLAPRTFHIFCLFDDLQNIRAFIRESWSEYLNGKIDLMNAAVVTNTALKLARGLIAEFEFECREPKPGSQIAQLRIYNLVARTRGKDPWELELEDVATWCYLPTKLMLFGYGELVLPDEPEVSELFLPYFKNKLSNTHKMENRRESMLALDRLNEDQAILHQCLEVFSFLVGMNPSFPVLDEITKCLGHFTQDRRPLLWFSFVAQIFLDVYHTLPHDQAQPHKSTKAFGDLKFSALRVKKITEEHWKFSKSLPEVSFWPKNCYGAAYIQSIYDNVQWLIIDDGVWEKKKEKYQEKYWSTFEKHEHFKRNPVLCGLMMFVINIRTESIGYHYINKWSTGIQLAHLYNLVQRTTAKCPAWPDMKIFIGVYGEQDIFMGARPNTVSQSSKSFEMASKRNPAEVVVSNAGTGNMLLNEYCGCRPTVLNVPSISWLLAEIENFSLATKHGLAKTSISLQRKAWETSHEIGRLQFLQAIKDAMVCEEPRINFNYFGLHQRCIELMRLIRDKNPRRFVWPGGDKDMDDTHIGIMVEWILGSTLFGVTDVMKQYLAKNGDVACRQLRAFSKAYKNDQADMVLEDAKRYTYWRCLEDVIDRDVFALMTGMSTRSDWGRDARKEA